MNDNNGATMRQAVSVELMAKTDELLCRQIESQFEMNQGTEKCLRTFFRVRPRKYMNNIVFLWDAPKEYHQR